MSRWSGAVLCSVVIFMHCACRPHSCDSIDQRLVRDMHLADTTMMIEVVVAEPLIEAPVLMDMDLHGRLWIAEMPDYMPDIDGRLEEEPRGRIVILSDTDGDGRMDQRKVFLQNIHQPRSLALIYGGLIYASAPNLWYVPIIDDQPGPQVLIDSMYAVGGNVEHQPNSLMRHVDNWLYSAKSKRRYRKVDGQWISEATAFRGQWGISSDDVGRLYYNDNSNGLYGDLWLPNTISRQPYFNDYPGLQAHILKDRAIYPLHSTAVNRGYIEGGLDSIGRVKYMTSTCSPLILGMDWADTYQEDALICAPEGNLIKRVKLLEDDGLLSATNVYQASEWLASTDEGFRPVGIYNGMDECLYIVDFHRGIIQHHTYMTAYLRSLILDRGLDQITGMGRVFRIKSKHQKAPINWSDRSTSHIVSLLGHPNRTVRLKAQELLIHAEEEINDLMHKRLVSADDEIEKIHLLYVLEGRDAIDIVSLLTSLRMDQPWYHRHLLKIAVGSQSAHLADLVEASMPYTAVDGYTAYALGYLAKTGDGSNEVFEMLGQLLDRHPDDKGIRQMILASTGADHQTWSRLDRSLGDDLLSRQVMELKQNFDKERIHSFHRPPNPDLKDDKTRGRSLYKDHCASCHSLDGEGITHLAPAVKGSRILEHSAEALALTLLTGLQGPVTIDGQVEDYAASMPGLRDNPMLTDQDILDIVHFVANAYRSQPDQLSLDRMAALRKVAEQKAALWTEKEILQVF